MTISSAATAGSAEVSTRPGWAMTIRATLPPTRLLASMRAAERVAPNRGDVELMSSRASCSNSVATACRNAPTSDWNGLWPLTVPVQRGSRNLATLRCAIETLPPLTVMRKRSPRAWSMAMRALSDLTPVRSSVAKLSANPPVAIERLLRRTSLSRGPGDARSNLTSTPCARRSFNKALTAATGVCAHPEAAVIKPSRNRNPASAARSREIACCETTNDTTPHPVPDKFLAAPDGGGCTVQQKHAHDQSRQGLARVTAGGYANAMPCSGI